MFAHFISICIGLFHNYGRIHLNYGRIHLMTKMRPLDEKESCLRFRIQKIAHRYLMEFYSCGYISKSYVYYPEVDLREKMSENMLE